MPPSGVTKPQRVRCTAVFVMWWLLYRITVQVHWSTNLSYLIATANVWETFTGYSWILLTNTSAVFRDTMSIYAVRDWSKINPSIYQKLLLISDSSQQIDVIGQCTHFISIWGICKDIQSKTPMTVYNKHFRQKTIDVDAIWIYVNCFIYSTTHASLQVLSACTIFCKCPCDWLSNWWLFHINFLKIHTQNYCEQSIITVVTKRKTSFLKWWNLLVMTPLYTRKT